MINGAPWPVSVLGIGDSYTNNPGQPDWSEYFITTQPGVTYVNEATSGKCLYDTTGGLGSDTVLNSIGADLIANPAADFVVWATCCINDILRVKQGLASTTEANLTSSITAVLGLISTQNKRCIVMAVPFVQALINGFGAGDATSSQTAYALRSAANAWLATECARLGHIYYDPKYLYNDFGPLEAGLNNGVKNEYSIDGLHINELGNRLIAEDISGRLRANNWRRALVA